jgi:hypothetical protein
MTCTINDTTAKLQGPILRALSMRCCEVPMFADHNLAET